MKELGKDSSVTQLQVLRSSCQTDQNTFSGNLLGCLETRVKFAMKWELLEHQCHCCFKASFMSPQEAPAPTVRHPSSLDKLNTPDKTKFKLFCQTGMFGGVKERLSN